MDIFTPEDKSRVGKRLTLLIADLWENQTLSQKQVREAGQFVLDNIHMIKTKDELISFLENLTQKFPQFAQVLDEEKAQTQQNSDQQKVDQVENLMKENKVDEALQVVQDDKRDDVKEEEQ